MAAIPSYGGYSITEDGRVWSFKTNKFLRDSDDGAGYRTLMLYRGGARKQFRVHQLVALAFIGPVPEGLEVLHDDGNRANNARYNIKYGTKSKNAMDSIRHGTHRNTRKDHCKRGHEFTPENTYIRPNGGRNCRQCRVELNY